MTVSIELDQNEPAISESSLAVLDYVPLVSVLSGVARIFFGGIETVAGVVALPFQLTGRICGYPQSLIFNHGIANIVRGLIASTGTLFVGNVVLYLYDHSLVVKRDFQQSSGLIQ